MGIRHLKCPMEVGWSINVENRQKEHYNNGSTTYIFGFLNAWVRMTPGIKFPGPAQYTLFRVWHHEHLPQCSEILGSILCSSYSSQGGLNCTESWGVVGFGRRSIETITQV